MFELPTQLSSIGLEIANVRASIPMRQDDDDTDREMSNDESEDLGKSTLWSDIEKDHLGNRLEVLHLEQVVCDQTIQTTRVPLWKQWSRADTVIARTPLPNLRHPVRAIAPPLLKRQKTTFNISRESEVVQVLPLPKSSGDQNVPQPKPGGDHNVPQHQKATFEIAQLFMEAIIFAKTPWPIISADKYWMVDEAW